MTHLTKTRGVYWIGGGGGSIDCLPPDILVKEPQPELPTEELPEEAQPTVDLEKPNEDPISRLTELKNEGYLNEGEYDLAEELREIPSIFVSRIPTRFYAGRAQTTQGALKKDEEEGEVPTYLLPEEAQPTIDLDELKAKEESETEIPSPFTYWPLKVVGRFRFERFNVKESVSTADLDEQ